MSFKVLLIHARTRVERYVTVQASGSTFKDMVQALRREYKRVWEIEEWEILQ